MTRSYHGNVDYATLRDLQRLCEVNAENMKILMDAFTERGEVSFYTNLCPITREPDEMSTLHTLKSEEEIREYLKEDFKNRVERYLASQKPEEDYLLNILIDFIKENGGNYPSENEMRQLEEAAEAKRVDDTK